MTPNFDAIRIRNRIKSCVSHYMHENDFQYVDTPLMKHRTLPSFTQYSVDNLESQELYLSESPQIFKLLLIGHGFRNYYQFAHCVRRQRRNDRKIDGVHTQIDIETTSYNRIGFLRFIESLMLEIVDSLNVHSFIINPHFPIMTHKHSMKEFASDKPDLRNPVKLLHLNNQAIALTFEPPENIHKIQDILQSEIFKSEQLNCKFLTSHDQTPEAELINEKLSSAIKWKGVKNWMAVLIRDTSEHNYAAGRIRNLIATHLDLLDNRILSFCWVVEFPLFKIKNNRLFIQHDLFSKPIQNNASDALGPTSRCHQFDLICNGMEIASGAHRNTSLASVLQVMEMCGIARANFKDTYPELYKCYEGGMPHSIGCGIGIERLMMLLMKASRIEQVVNFSPS